MFIEHEIQVLAPSLRFTRDEHVQLIRFAPLLAMIWADREQQAEEIMLFRSFVGRFAINWLPGLPEHEALEFFAPYLQDSISDAQHAELIRLFHYLVNHFEHALTEDRKFDLYRLCQDIASASRSAKHSALGLDEGAETCISAEEQVLLLEMIHALHLHPEVKLSLFAARSAKLFALRD